jgi:hypothetical protein
MESKLDTIIEMLNKFVPIFELIDEGMKERIKKAVSKKQTIKKPSNFPTMKRSTFMHYVANYKNDISEYIKTFYNVKYNDKGKEYFEHKDQKDEDGKLFIRTRAKIHGEVWKIHKARNDDIFKQVLSIKSKDDKRANDELEKYKVEHKEEYDEYVNKKTQNLLLKKQKKLKEEMLKANFKSE